MERLTENRSLDRALDILTSLSIHGASSLHDLNTRTGLPKSTIRRLLGTLIRRKIVRRSLNDRLYRANIALPMQYGGKVEPREGWLVNCAVPYMIEMTRCVGWSCDLHIFERVRSRVIESTRPLSPFFQYGRQIDLEVSVFASAGGLAVLSTWTEPEVLALVEEIGDDPAWGLARLGMSKRDLLATLQHIRALGYATRLSQYRGETAKANKLNALARPVMHKDAAVGALVMLWPKDFLGPARFAEIHLDRLKESADCISAELTRIQPRSGAAGTSPRAAPELRAAQGLS